MRSLLNVFSILAGVAGSAFYTYYVVTSYIDVPWQAAAMHVALVPEYLSVPTMSSFTVNFGEHLLLAYSLWFYLNLKLFDLNMMLDRHLFTLGFLSQFILYVYYLRQNLTKSLTSIETVFAFAIIACASIILFNIGQGSGQQMDLQFAYASIISFIVVYLHSKNSLSTASRILAILLTLIYGMFSGMYFGGLFACILVISFFQWGNRGTKTYFLVLFATFLTMIFLYRLASPSAISHSGESFGIDKAVVIIANFSNAIGFMLTALSASVLSAAALEMLGSNISLSHGILLLVLVFIGIFLSKASAIPSWKIAFPLALLAYGFAIAGSLIVGRSDQVTENYAWASMIWYSPHWKMFALGLLAFPILLIFSGNRSFKTPNFAYSVIVLCVLGSSGLYSSFVEFKRIPHIAAFWDKMKIDALNPDYLRIAEGHGLTSFALPKNETIKMLNILQEHNLSIYRGNPDINSSTNFTYIDNSKLMLGPGFSSDRWIGPEASVHIEVINHKEVITMRFVPAPTIARVTCGFYVSGEMVMEEAFIADQISQVKLPAGPLLQAYGSSWMNIRVSCDSHFMPTNGDKRALSLHLRQIEQQFLP